MTILIKNKYKTFHNSKKETCSFLTSNMRESMPSPSCIIHQQKNGGNTGVLFEKSDTKSQIILREDESRTSEV